MKDGVSKITFSSFSYHYKIDKLRVSTLAGYPLRHPKSSGDKLAAAPARKMAQHQVVLGVEAVPENFRCLAPLGMKIPKNVSQWNLEYWQIQTGLHQKI